MVGFILTRAKKGVAAVMLMINYQQDIIFYNQQQLTGL